MADPRANSQRYGFAQYPTTPSGSVAIIRTLHGRLPQVHLTCAVAGDGAALEAHGCGPVHRGLARVDHASILECKRRVMATTVG
jgi:hypothetical protein